MQYLIITVIGYLLGCIPSGLFAGRWLGGIDIREYGSKNIGTTNIFRVLGPKPAAVVLLADMGKGMLAVYTAIYLDGGEISLLLGGIAAILGHNYPVFLAFNGGRGVATGLGVILVLMPEVTVIVFALWALIVFITRYVSLGSVIAAALVPILSWYFVYPWQFTLFGGAAAAFIILRHRENIGRLLKGTENKIKPGSKNKLKSKDCA